jgi:hypothetical protein
MFSISVWVILGTNTPLVVEVTSKIDDAFGLLVPIPCCEKASLGHKPRINIPRKNKHKLFINTSV